MTIYKLFGNNEPDREKQAQEFEIASPSPATEKAPLLDPLLSRVKSFVFYRFICSVVLLLFLLITVGSMCIGASSFFCAALFLGNSSLFNRATIACWSTFKVCLTLSIACLIGLFSLTLSISFLMSFFLLDNKNVSNIYAMQLLQKQIMTLFQKIDR